MALCRSLVVLVGFLLVMATGGVADAGTTQSVRGGDIFFANGQRCTVGVTVRGGFLAAGHCGAVGTVVTAPNQATLGTVQASDGYLVWVVLASGWTPVGMVGAIAVLGSQDAPVGSSVCRTGSTTGWRCGTLQQRNAALTTPQGTVYGLVKAGICGEPGDTGGVLFAGGQVQGLLLGGSGNCSSGGTSYYKPVNPFLRAHGLRLLTS
jgi:streptogrisin C